jgi:hypothetical protein
MIDVTTLTPERIQEARVKPYKECNQEDKEIRAIEVIRCEGDFIYFLQNYVKVLVPPKPGQTGTEGIISFEVRPHMAKAIHGLLNYKQIVWMKSRQIWASTLMSSYDVWYFRFHKGAKVMILSKGETEAQEKIRKCKVVYSNLPDWMRLPLGAESTTLMSLPPMQSDIQAFPATKAAGVGYTASIIDCDEWAQQEYAAENYLNLEPCRSAGGQFIGTFTPTITGDTYAESVFKDAIGWPEYKSRVVNGVILLDYSKSRNGFYAIFDGWNVVPGRTQEWYDAEKKSIPSEEMAGISPELFMAKAYPTSIEEAFSGKSAVNAFDHDILHSMMSDVRNPVKMPELDNKLCHVYKPWTVGGAYVSASDTSHGTGGDYSVTVIINARNGEVVADLISNVISVDDFAYHSMKLLEVYHKPKWWIEANDWGGSTIAKAEEQGYKNLGYQDEKKTKPGFLTGAKNRNELWGELITGINNRQITIYNQDGIRQFLDVIRVAEKQGRIEAKQGGHDDYTMAVGIAWLKRGEAVPGEWKPRVISSLHF